MWLVSLRIATLGQNRLWIQSYAAVVVEEWVESACDDDEVLTVVPPCQITKTSSFAFLFRISQTGVVKCDFASAHKSSLPVRFDLVQIPVRSLGCGFNLGFKPCTSPVQVQSTDDDDRWVDDYHDHIW